MYNRDYLLSGKQEQSNTINVSKFISATYQLFAASLLAGAAGAYVGVGIVSLLQGILFWGLVIVEIGLIFAISRFAHTQGVNLILLFLFTFITGLTSAPLIANTLNIPDGGAIVGQAFFLTAIGFGAISMFAMTTKKDFRFLQTFLIIAVIIMIVASLINIFFTNSSLLQIVIASVGALVFSAFILVDTQKLIRGDYGTPIEAALSLYLDFLNLFMSLLQILGALSKRE